LSLSEAAHIANRRGESGWSAIEVGCSFIAPPAPLVTTLTRCAAHCRALSGESEIDLAHWTAPSCFRLSACSSRV